MTYSGSALPDVPNPVPVPNLAKELRRLAVVMEGDIVLKEGDKAPDFTTVDHEGNEVKLADLKGKKVWLWFFSSPGGGN